MSYNYFDAAYGINLDHRTDRWAEFMEQAKAVGLSITRYPAIQPTLEETSWPWANLEDSRRHNKYGCTLSHMGCIRDAKDHGYKRILIFEDDATFLPAWNELSVYIEELKSIPSWDICYFGGSPDHGWHTKEVEKLCPKVTEHLYQCDVVWGAHAYAVNQIFYDKILSTDPRICFPFDMNLIHYPPSKRTYLITKQLLVTQSDSHSDLTGERLSRTKIYEDNYRKCII